MKFTQSLEGMVWDGAQPVDPEPTPPGQMPKPFTPDYKQYLAENVSFVTGAGNTFLSGWKAALRHAEGGFVLSCAELAYAREEMLPVITEKLGEHFHLSTSTFEISTHDYSGSHYPAKGFRFKPIIATIHGSKIPLSEVRDNNQNVLVFGEDDDCDQMRMSRVDAYLLNPMTSRVFKYDVTYSPLLTKREFTVLMPYDLAASSQTLAKSPVHPADSQMPLEYARLGLQDNVFLRNITQVNLAGQNYVSFHEWGRRGWSDRLFNGIPRYNFEVRPVKMIREGTGSTDIESVNSRDFIFAVIRKPSGRAVQLK